MQGPTRAIKGIFLVLPQRLYKADLDGAQELRMLNSSLLWDLSSPPVIIYKKMEVLTDIFARGTLPEIFYTNTLTGSSESPSVT